MSLTAPYGASAKKATPAKAKKTRAARAPARLNSGPSPALISTWSALTLQGKPLTAKLKQAVTDGSIEQTIEGASTLSLTVADWAHGLFRSQILTGKVTLTFDGLRFTMVKLSKGESNLTLTFEETAVNLLRGYSKPRKADRATTTRAQFVRSLVTEVKEARIPFRAPEINKRQPVGDQVRLMLTVKHVAAGSQQQQNLRLLCQIAKSMGANKSQMAGAMATMIQESAAINMQGGDRDSAGLFQQRPSVGVWGTYAQVTDPVHACKAFLTPFLAYCRQGMGLFDASHKVQVSAYPAAPIQWYSESVSNVNQIMSGKDFGDATLTGAAVSGSISTTRTKPYEFSRGNAGQSENSWDCIGRLASEVSWDRFMRAGELWFVSETWLKNQPPRFAISEGARGVISVAFDADSRRDAAQMTVTALAKRWSVLPGDVVQVSGQGPGDGLWLVHGTRRTLSDDSTEITLKRPAPAKPEPANETETVTVAGVSTGGKNASGGEPRSTGALFAACQEMSRMNIPYSISARNLVQRPPSADCSSSCCWALLKAGFPLPGGASWGAWAPVSGNFSAWGEEGYGKTFTVMWTGEHIWIRFYNYPAIRFDTSPWGSGGYGPHLRTTRRNDTEFGHRHWPGL